MSSLYKKNFLNIKWAPITQRKSVIRTPPKRAAFPCPMIARDYEAYECPVTGKMIEGRAAHAENLKRTGCRLLEKGEFEDVKKNGRKEAEARMDAALDKAVDEVAAQLDI